MFVSLWFAWGLSGGSVTQVWLWSLLIMIAHPDAQSNLLGTR